MLIFLFQSVLPHICQHRKIMIEKALGTLLRQKRIQYTQSAIRLDFQRGYLSYGNRK